MKLLIDISPCVYNLCQIVSSKENEYVSALENAIKDGTPIKDGDLISRSALKMYAKCGIRAEDCIGDCDKCSDYCVAVNDIDNAPTIGDT